MNDIREILTKAVIGKGIKSFELTVKMPAIENEINEILGIYITNHIMESDIKQNKIKATGTFDIHCWYSCNDESESSIVKTTVDYGDVLTLENPLRDKILATDEIMLEEMTKPEASNIQLQNNEIILTIAFDLSAEVIGETKMRVVILGPAVERAPAFSFDSRKPSFQTASAAPSDDDLADIDEAITPDFLSTTFE